MPYEIHLDSLKLKFTCLVVSQLVAVLIGIFCSICTCSQGGSIFFHSEHFLKVLVYYLNLNFVQYTDLFET